MMLHQDGSTHEWVPGCQWDLIVTLDDATSEIYSAFFVEEEGTLSSLRGLREVIETKGLFSSLYTDRGSHYWYTEEAGGQGGQDSLTQVHRALQQLGMTLIPAYSPEARGRSERAFRTLQDRLPKELALAGITEMAAANRYLTEQFLPQHNERFMVRATEPGTAFIPWVGTSLAEILCVQEERVVAKDNTVRYQGTSLQIPQNPHRFHYVKVTCGCMNIQMGPWPCSMGPVSGALPRGWPADRDRGEPRRRKDPTPRSGAPRSLILGQRCANISARG